MPSFQNPLNEHKIREYCTPFFSEQTPHLHVFTSIDSTNQYLKHLPASSSIELCCADEQTNGRGRLGRNWYSPAGENIYCSIRWPLSCHIKKLSALSLIVALAILASLKHLNIHQEIWIKWPNDLYWQGKKLGGILIESSSDAMNHLCTIGIGLNINIQSSLEDIQNQLNRPWCSLLDITGKCWDRNQIIGVCCGIINQYIQRYVTEGFEPFRAEWEKADGLYQQTIQLTLSNTHTLQGTALGVTEMGQLRVVDHQGELHLISSGEVTQFSYFKPEV